MKTYKEIFTEWHNEFPFLKQYSPSTLFQKVGPMLIGLRIEQPWEEIYRVILEAIPLWKTERKDFGDTILYDPLRNKKRGQILTTFRHHDLDFKEVLEDAKRLYGLVLTPNIPLNDLIEYLEIQSTRKHGDCRLKGCDTIELELAIATYLNKEELYNDIWEDAMKATKVWNAENFKFGMGISIEEWIESMHSMFENRDKFIETVEWNYQRPRVAKLNTGYITKVDEYTRYVPKLSWREKLRSLFIKQYFGYFLRVF